MTDSFYDEIKTLPLEEGSGEKMAGFNNSSSGRRKLKKRKRSIEVNEDTNMHGCGTIGSSLVGRGN